MVHNKKWFYGFILLFLGNTLLLRSTEFSIILSIIIILLGHLFIILIEKGWTVNGRIYESMDIHV